ncbi:MAG: hypothetical protein WBD20_04875 [Pirellulaceae bacterium]
MGSRLHIFSLYKHSSQAALLLRVERRESSNADEADCSSAIEEAYDCRERLLAHTTSALNLDTNIAPELVGEYQNFPVGDLLYEAPDGAAFDIWVAPTRYGHPWVILGTATDEQSFWAEVADDSDLESFGATPPAQKMTVQFFTERVL